MRSTGKPQLRVCPAIALGISMALSFAAHSVVTADAGQAETTISSLPEQLDKNCRKGRAKLFDECGDQIRLFKAARKRAAVEGKVVLVSFGAEWCIWCHVFDQYVHGGKTRFTYTFGTPSEPDMGETATLHEKEKRDVTEDARALNDYVSKSFVLVHIDGQFAPNGYEVLRLAGADRHYDGGLPFIFTVNADGIYAARLEPKRVETRRDGWFDWYRGYSRADLIAHLAELRKAASGE